MAFGVKQNLSLKISQRMLITPKLQQAIKVLQLSRLDLSEFISEQLADNPVLEEHSENDAERESTEEQAIHEHIIEASSIVDPVSQEAPELDWENLARMREATNSTNVARNRDKSLPYSYENISSRAVSLQEHLTTQITELNLTKHEQQLAALFIGNLDERGYLACELDELSHTENISLQDLEGVLDIIQHLEPSGVGAKDLRSCLLIQLRDNSGRNGIVEKIVDRHLDNLVSKNFQIIAKDLGITVKQVIDNAQIISELEPDPARQFGGEAMHYIVPDAQVFKSGNKWQVSLNEDGLPRLNINSHYRQMRKECGKSERVYIEEKMKSAEWLIKSIQQRQNTIYRVTMCIVDKQCEFFEGGIEYLKPMVLRDIAKELSLHESTISRVTNGKYVHTPHGLLELKFFFNSAVSSSTKGGGVASEAVKRKINEFIRNENSKRPLSDQAIVSLLGETNVQLARRTVAKYREQLGIPPSNKRKKFF